MHFYVGTHHRYKTWVVIGVFYPGTRFGGRKLKVWTSEHDTMRQKLLTDRGYSKGKQPEFQRRRPVSQPVPDVPLAEGYTVRPLGDIEEMPARSFVSWKAFHPDESNDQYEGWEWYHNIQRAPLYRRDLDIVAVAPNGEFASFCTIWFDDVTRTAAFEPVGTAPAHQKRGLGKAVMYEGLRRLKRLGATLAYVGSYTPGAHALYASVGFTEYVGHPVYQRPPQAGGIPRKFSGTKPANHRLSDIPNFGHDWAGKRGSPARGLSQGSYLMNKLRLLVIVSSIIMLIPLSSSATTIFEAAEQGDLAQVQALLQEDPQLLNAVDDGGYTPLHEAAYNGQIEILDYLIAKGANLNATSASGSTPLHGAAFHGYVKAAERLIEEGAAIEVRNAGGFTPFLGACAGG